MIDLEQNQVILSESEIYFEFSYFQEFPFKVKNNYLI